MAEKLKPVVLWLTENYYPNRGGMAQSCDRIVQSLRNLGLFIGLVHFRSSKNKLKMKTVQNGFYLAMPADEDSGHSYNVLLAFLSNPGNSYNFTHIVAFGGYLPVLGGPVLSKLLKIELVTFLRGNDFDSFIFSAKKRDFLFYAINNSKVICTVTKEQKEKIEKLIPHHNVQYIPNGIDIAEWNPHASELENAKKWKSENVKSGKRVIGVFGHLKPKKGLDLFIHSVVLSGIQEKIFLLISGETDKAIEQSLDAAGVDYFISPFLDRFEMLAWYPACDAVAIPSIYDGMPNVLLEAAALSIPIIASNVGGMRDILTEGKHGFIFQPADEQSCARAISRFISSSEEELLRMGQNCKNLVKNSYTAEIEANSYFNLFTEY